MGMEGLISFDFLLHDGLNKSIAVVTVHMHSNHCYTFIQLRFHML